LEGRFDRGVKVVREAGEEINGGGCGMKGFDAVSQRLNHSAGIVFSLEALQGGVEFVSIDIGGGEEFQLLQERCSAALRLGLPERNGGGIRDHDGSFFSQRMGVGHLGLPLRLMA
jgi:hypothetical protein